MTASIIQVSPKTEEFGPPSRSDTGNTTSTTSTTESQVKFPSEAIELRELRTDRRSRNRTSDSGPSPTAEQHFLGALKSRIRGRSRNRSQDSSHNRSRSPMPPPIRMASDRGLSASSPRPRSARQDSTYSGSTLVGPSEPSNRQDTGASQQSSQSRENFHWQGRHSNAWLFNDFSVIDTIKSVARKNRRGS